MDIKYFKPAYHELFNLLTKSSKLINKSFKIGAPEGPPVLRDVYELQMELRLTTLNNPPNEKIKQVLNYVLEYFNYYKTTTADVTNLKNDILKYLTKL